MRVRQVGEFYLTLLVPVMYGLGLYLIAREERAVSLWWQGGGLILAVTGLFLWGLSYLHLGKGFGVLPRRQEKRTKGVYQYLAHPMYVGIIVAFTGLALARGAWGGLGYTWGIAFPVLVMRAKMESKKLY